MLFKSDRSYLHGNAHFAKKRDLKREGFFAKEGQGMVLGKYGKRILRASRTHLSVAAPTGSGKGVGIVIPNLLDWNESIVVLDVKGENWEITSNYRQNILKQRCFYFNPLPKEDEEGVFRSHCYNPLDYIPVKQEGTYQSLTPVSLNELSKISTLLCPSDGGGGDKFWDNAARDFLETGLIFLFEFFPKEERNLGKLYNIVQNLKAQREVYQLIHFALQNPKDYKLLLDSEKIPCSLKAKELLWEEEEEESFKEEARNSVKASLLKELLNLYEEYSNLSENDKKTFQELGPLISRKTLDYWTTLNENKVEVSNTLRLRLMKLSDQSEEDKMEGSILATLLSKLQIFQNPILQQTMMKSSFDFRTLRRNRQSIYLVVDPASINMLKPLLNLFFSQLIECLMSEMPKKDEPYKVFFLLDEFPLIGKMTSLFAATAAIRGYGGRLLCIYQDDSQLRSVYSTNEAESFLANLGTSVFFAPSPKNVVLCDKLSKIVGTKTVKTKSYSKGGVTQSESSRELVKSQEIPKFLGKKHALISSEGLPPIYAKKIFYFKDKNYNEKISPALIPPTIN